MHNKIIIKQIISAALSLAIIFLSVYNKPVSANSVYSDSEQIIIIDAGHAALENTID